MGRPLKIAKAQAVLTVTATTNAGVVTVTDNLTTAPTVGVIAGMPFVMATTTGGLTAGVVYYIKAITGNHTFTVASTDPSVQPQTSPSMSNAGPVTVKATVAPVDMYFNNPNGPQWPSTNANTYSVVGGNTSLYGKQVLANVALGVSGAGTLYSVSTSSTKVGGVGTSFATTAAASSVIQYIPANGVPTTLGYVSSNAQPNIEISNATATGNFLTTVGAATSLTANLPVTLTANIGNLTAGTIYFVKTIANATAFSVSTTPGGANVALTNENATSYAKQDIITLATNATALVANSAYIYATPRAGFIVRQKGKQKYLVQDSSGLVGQCLTANVANTAMLPNTMTITATYANSATVKVQSLSDHTGELFTATSGPVASGNIVLENAAPAFTTFNSAIAANSTQYSDFSYGNAQPYPIVQIGNA